MSNKKCLYCYRELAEDTPGDFHERCSLNFFGTKEQPLFDYSLSQMAALAKNVVERSVTLRGVHPKLPLSLVRDTIRGTKNGRLTVSGPLDGNYILKPPSDHYPEMPANEHITMRIAGSFGIRVVRSGMIRLKSGELSYISKRIDRTDSGEKIHMLDMFQITEAFDKYRGSMETVGKALHAYSANTLLDKVYFLELAVFSFLTGNNDMHLKNLSMILRNGQWTLAPAYDLLNAAIVNPGDTEDVALTLEGIKRNLHWEHFRRLGKYLGLNDKQINGIAKRFRQKRSVALQWIDRSFLSEEYKEKYRNVLAERYARIDGDI